MNLQARNDRVRLLVELFGTNFLVALDVYSDFGAAAIHAVKVR